jgi:D-glycero-alpha-D-manno-heptose-7-phosphate kinase
MEFLVHENDLVVAISSSGNSMNIVNAIETAKKRRATVVTFTGFKADNKSKQLGDVNVYVPSEKYGIVESIHNLILQQIVDMIMERDGKKSGCISGSSEKCFDKNEGYVMIITKTPFRMSFFGGGTDIQEYFVEHGGSVISSTFDKYCYVNVRRLPGFFDYKNEFVYSKIERVNEIDKIEHPAIKSAMQMMKLDNVRLAYEADLPARSGLGTSSSFAVGMLGAFHALKGEYVDKKKLADEAIYLERVLCEEMGGWQDQIAAAYGGLNRIDFREDGYEVKPIVISNERKKQLNDNLVMFFTGFTRFSSEVQKINSEKKDKHKILQEMQVLVDEAEKVLTDSASSIDEFGRLLDYTWKLKRNTGSAVTTDGIDEIYRKGIKAGALGGKLLGAGGGGFFVFYVTPDKREDLMRQMEELLCIPFEFENSGTQVMYYKAE